MVHPWDAIWRHPKHTQRGQGSDGFNASKSRSQIMVYGKNTYIN